MTPRKPPLAALSFHSAIIAGLLNSVGLSLKIFGPFTKLFPYLIPYGDPLQFPASVSHGSKFSRIHRAYPFLASHWAGLLGQIPPSEARDEVRRREPTLINIG